jgi:hypothetical protein
MADEGVESIVRRAMEPLRETIREVGKDAREARDGMISLTAKLDGQDMAARIEKLATDMLAEHNSLRQDMVLAIGNVRSDQARLSTRIDALESDKQERTGGFILVKMVKDYAGWFIGIGAAAAALYEKLSAK